MRYVVGQNLVASIVALAVGLALFGVAAAQEQQPQAAQTLDAGLIEGAVARCINGTEFPAAGVSVGVEGGSASLVRTDSSGGFILGLPSGTYTIVATADDGVASRQYVPVDAGATLDIGVLDLGSGISGCGPDVVDVAAPVLPTFTPTPLAVVDLPTPTPVPPTPVPPTATPLPTPVSPPAEPTDTAA